MRIVVLGAGRVGSAIAIDLARDSEFDVRIADRDANRLESLHATHGIPGERVDFSLPSTVTRAVAETDLVLSAVPGFLGFRTLEAIIEAGKDVVDIAFFPEGPFRLDQLAKERGVTAIVDCGVAPGMSNLLVGHAHGLLDRTDSVAIYVGGLPAERTGPYEYRAVFSPIDVIEEYVRPARFVVDGQTVIKPALTDVEPIAFDALGALEAFNTDGLRTLAETIGAPNMIEKTLRYPGHADKVRILRDSGFFSEEPIEVDGHDIRPLDVATALLFPMWKLKDGEKDVTVMRILVDGEQDGAPVRYRYDLTDRFDVVTGTSSMARTTGYAATAAARLLAAGRFSEPGIIPPERLAQHEGCVEFILRGLETKGIRYVETIDR